jgi:hypothetical protein
MSHFLSIVQHEVSIATLEPNLERHDRVQIVHEAWKVLRDLEIVRPLRSFG